MNRIPTAGAVLLAAVLSAPAPAQTIRGRVLDAASGEPVAQATISVLDADGHVSARGRSVADGSFDLRLRAAGIFRLRGERTGYGVATSHPVEVAVRETVVVALRVSAQPTQIEPLTVTTRQQPAHRAALAATGFYEREARGVGRFLRREDIERVPESNVVHVLARVPGVTLDVNRAGTEIVTFSRARIQGTLSRAGRMTETCYPAIYLDGARMSYGDQSHPVARSVDSTLPNLANLVPVAQIEAVELYRSAAEIPSQYSGSDASCGVIVLWTRHEIETPPTTR